VLAGRSGHFVAVVRLNSTGSLDTEFNGDGKHAFRYATGDDQVCSEGGQWLADFVRHTFASRRARAGIDLVTLDGSLGRTRVQMLFRYAHPFEEHKAIAVRKLKKYNGSRKKVAKMGAPHGSRRSGKIVDQTSLLS